MEPVLTIRNYGVGNEKVSACVTVPRLIGPLSDLRSMKMILFSGVFVAKA